METFPEPAPVRGSDTGFLKNGRVIPCARVTLSGGCGGDSRCEYSPPQGTGGSFSIDSEEYEAMPVEVKLLPRKLQFFCDPRKREQLLPRSAP